MASNLPGGRIIRILERAHDTIVGTLQQTRNFSYVVPDDPRFVHNVYVHPRPLPGAPRPPQPNDKVVVRLETWESRHVNPEGEIIELLGRATDPGVDMLSIIRKYDLPLEFPEAVLGAANDIPETVDPDASTIAKICAANSLSRSIRTTRVISTMQSMSSDCRAATGNSASTSPMSPPTSHLAATRSRGAPARKQRLPARSRDPDVAGTIEQRRLQSQSQRRSADAFRFHPLREEWRCAQARFARTMIQSARRLTYKEAYRHSAKTA